MRLPLLQTLTILTGIIFFALSCNNSSTTSNETTQSQRDSSAKAASDSIQQSKVLDTVKKMGIVQLDPSSLSCDSIAKLLGKFGSISPQDYIALITQSTRCEADAYNRSHTDSQQLVVVHEDPANNKVLFNTISAKTADDIAKGAKVIIGIVGAVYTDGNPETTAGISLLGNYAVESYLTAAKNNDPLIIIMPSAIPAVQAAKDGFKISESVYKEALKLDLDKPITIQADAVKTVFAYSQKAADIAASTGLVNVVPVNVGSVHIKVPSPIPPVEIKHVGPIPIPVPHIHL